MAAEPDRFELIWPSGEIDDRFGATDTASLEGHHPDRDRAGPTARLVRGSGMQTMVEEPPTADVEVEPTPDDQALAEPPAVEADDDVTDDVVLAVRRAVASIETGSLAARRRLVEQPGDVDTSRGTDLVPPGRVAVREEPSRASQMAVRRPTRSVFDEVPPEQEPAVATLPEVEAPTVAEPATEPPAEERTGALRRLIGSLRRR